MEAVGSPNPKLVMLLNCFNLTCPIHPTSMTQWRNRVGVDRLERLLTETIALAVREKHLPKSDLERITGGRAIHAVSTVPGKKCGFVVDSRPFQD